jgi:hypothetical protein
MKPTEDEFGPRLAAKAADRETAFGEHWPAVRAQLEQRDYSSWGIGQAHSVLSRGWSVDEAVEALHTAEPERIPATLSREQRREQQLHRMAFFQHGLWLRKSVRGDERARDFGTYGLYANGTCWWSAARRPATDSASTTSRRPARPNGRDEDARRIGEPHLASGGTVAETVERLGVAPKQASLFAA